MKYVIFLAQVLLFCKPLKKDSLKKLPKTEASWIFLISYNYITQLIYNFKIILNIPKLFCYKFWSTPSNQLIYVYFKSQYSKMISITNYHIILVNQLPTLTSCYRLLSHLSLPVSNSPVFKKSPAISHTFPFTCFYINTMMFHVL